MDVAEIKKAIFGQMWEVQGYLVYLTTVGGTRSLEAFSPSNPLNSQSRHHLKSSNARTA